MLKTNLNVIPNLSEAKREFLSVVFLKPSVLSAGSGSGLNPVPVLVPDPPPVTVGHKPGVIHASVVGMHEYLALNTTAVLEIAMHDTSYRACLSV